MYESKSICAVLPTALRPARRKGARDGFPGRDTLLENLAKLKLLFDRKRARTGFIARLRYFDGAKTASSAE
jgi:hypothetical protein